MPAVHVRRYQIIATLLALVDDAPGANPLAGAAPYYSPRPLGYEELLASLLDASAETVRCLAAYHVGELGLLHLRSRLEALRSQPGGFFVGRVVERALKLLGPPPQQEWVPAT